MAPLAMLQKQDAIASRARARELQLKQRQAETDFKTFATAKLDTKGFLPFQKQLDDEAPAIYDQLLAVSQDAAMSPYQKKIAQDKLVAARAGRVNTTNEIEQKVNLLRGTVKADKRYNAAAVDKEWYTGFGVGIDNYDPATLEKTLENPAVFDRAEVVKQFIKDTFSADQSTVATAATPGGFGQKNQAISNLFEVENGRVKYDPKTNLPVLKTDSPEAVAAADNDPFLSKLLDQLQGDYDQKTEAVTAKMQNLEPLTPEEQQWMKTEIGKPMTRADFLNELLLPHAYKREQKIQTYRPRPQPRAASGGGGYTGPAPTGGYGVESVQTNTGTLNFPTTYAGTEPAVYSKDGTAKPVILKGSVFSNINLQVPGQPLQHILDNTEAQDLVLKGPKLVLVGPKGNIYTPSKAEYGDSPEALTQWYVGALRKNPKLRLTYAVQATAAKGENSLGSAEDMFNAVKASYTQTGNIDPEIAKIRAQFGTTKRTPSDPEIREKVRKIYGKQNGTYYIPYEGDSKRKLDVATGTYRKQEPQMQAEIARLRGLVKQKGTSNSAGLYNKKAGSGQPKTNTGGAY